MSSPDSHKTPAHSGENIKTLIYFASYRLISYIAQNNVANKHLHLVYKVKDSNGVYVFANPEEVINGSVNWEGGDPSTRKIIGGKIVGVECDTEDKVNIL